jgi:hypothetical protein
MHWQFIQEHAPHWEAAVKSFKAHLHKVVGNTRLTFEDMAKWQSAYAASTVALLWHSR